MKYVPTLVSYIKNPKFRNHVVALTKDPFVFRFQNFGELNPDRPICIVGMDDNGITQGGLLSELRNLIIRFALCEKFNFTPVVEFRNSLYDEKEPIDGTTNAFEFYYKQPAGIELSAAWKSKYVYISRAIDCLGIDELRIEYDVDEKQIKRMGELYSNYLHLNEKTEKFFVEEITVLLKNRKTLGVHMRGGDFKKLYEGHPIPVCAEEYFPYIDLLIEKKGYEQIFLATDDSYNVEKMKEKYGAKIVLYSDVMRTESEAGIHTIGHRNGYSGYRMGLEVLRDVYTLAETDALITGHSGAGLMARIIKSSKKKEYEDFILMDNGICHNNNFFPQRKV